MSEELTPRRSLDSLRKEAKRWLKALRTNVEDARTRLARAFPTAPDVPTLRDIQHALALEHGFVGWTALKASLARDGQADASQAALVDSFLNNASLDWRVGGSQRITAGRTADRLLKRHPEIARANLYTAVVCGDVAETERLLAERPHAASDSGGPRDWPPLLYLCSARLSHEATNDNAVNIARLLLDHGADANAFYPGGSPSIHYTAFTCVIGEGEENAPRHPHFEALTQLLLDRGAEPYDIQVLYNTHFHGQVLGLLQLMYAASVRRGREADWRDPNWSMLDMGGYGCGARYLLDVAVNRNDLALAEWCLAHGASPNPSPAPHRQGRTESLYEEAVALGHAAIAEMLAKHGAPRIVRPLEGEAAFSAACFRLDRDSARTLLAQHPEYLRSPITMFAAAKRDRTDVISLLLDLGVSVDVADAHGAHALHEAAYAGAARATAFLIARGAEIDPRETRHGATPLGFAVYGRREQTIELLGRVSRDVFELTWTGNIARLTELFREEPTRARIVTDGETPLMWLPDDETRAVQAVELFLAHRADPSIKNTNGETAADRAEQRGLDDAAEVLRAASLDAEQPSLRHYETIAQDLLDAYYSGTPAAMQRVWDNSWHRRNWQGMRTYMQLDLGKRPASEHEEVEITLDDTRFLVAREHGFESWAALAAYVGARAAGSTTIASKPVTLISVDESGAERTAGHGRDWDEVIATMQERQIVGLDAQGEMTDELLERISHIGHVVTLQLNGSKRLTDAGIRHLSRMPQLRQLNLSGCSITDHGLSVLRDLPALRNVDLSWNDKISDAGVATLASCDALERVNLSFTHTGDGALKALAGKARLAHVRTGHQVTDAGLALFHEFPVFKNWHGGAPSMALLSYDAGPNYLMPRGPLTDKGLANLAGLDGLFALNLNASELATTAAGLAPLVSLPNLGWLACDATDESMPFIAAMAHLRFLACQDTVAGDDGFVALSRSRSIEYLWGRRCHNLHARGFAALAAIPTLRALSVSGKNVDESGLAALPDFPALIELMPMDVPDDGYRYIAQCEQLESLVLMYCRDTTDAATEHIARLPALKKYFASYTKITDRSPELLATMPSLERIELSAIPGISNRGVAALAAAPRLRELHLSGMQHVSRDATDAFPARIQVHFSAW